MAFVVDCMDYDAVVDGVNVDPADCVDIPKDKVLVSVAAVAVAVVALVECDSLMPLLVEPLNLLQMLVFAMA